MASASKGFGSTRGGARRVAAACCLILASFVGNAGCGGGGGGGEGPGSLEPYVPTQVGAYIDYQHTSGATTTTRRVQVMSSSETRLFWRITYSDNAVFDNHAWYVLAGGGQYAAASLDCPFDGSACTSIYTYSPPALVLPASTTPGSSETTTSTVTSSISYTVTRTATVDGTETVTVPEGTFTALKITTRIVNGSSVSYNVTWWVRGIGRVKIANYAALDQPPQNTWQMTAHGVEALPAADPVPVSIALDAGQSIVATVAVTGKIPTLTITGLATGDLASLSGARIFVMIEDPSALVSPGALSAAPDGTFALTLAGRTLSTPGHFIGTMKLHAFLDPDGRRPFGGSPLLVPYDVTVLP